ncbi:MAG: hypothetical protein JO223_00380 [Hyphomicrobiales bacterium]|nr:hypothetical protein [Hyphomicrobiales bacterium]MBV8439924.1 hypothetical protein [Hyphomicrobiales bacterium]
MRNTFTRKIRATAARKGSRAAEEQNELALLAEFTRHDSVTALAGAMAQRLGGAVRDKDLIAGADIGSLRDQA